jgi:nitroimidazol reductase NimA-like FMN-containing flavoprotein (pyridoxamine 5'-phosphate oxidase superfamily)
MVIEPMSDRECRELLARTHTARLGCSLDNQPYIVPIHVDYYDGCLYAFSTLGQKIEWMRANPRVCVEVDELTTRRDWESVVVLGVYEELTGDARFALARSDAESLFQRHPVWWEPAMVPLSGRQSRSSIVYRIIINSMSGRRARREDDEMQLVADAAQETRRPQWLTDVLRRIISRTSAK